MTSLTLLKVLVNGNSCFFYSMGPDNVVDILVHSCGCMNIFMCSVVFSDRDFLKYVDVILIVYVDM